MQRKLKPIILAVLAGVAGAAADIASAHQQHSTGGHGHERRVVPAGEATPGISLNVLADGLSGYNVEVATANFRFSPENTGMPGDMVEGHAHLYVNGEKKGRLYGPWFHLPGEWLVPGENVVRVTLNDNQHADWVAEGKPIAAEVVLTGPEDQPGRAIELHVADGGAAETVTVGRGERVRLLVHCGGREELHLHGYDLAATAGPDRPAVFAFTAAHAGRFPLVVHGGKGLLGRDEVPVAYLEVRGQ